MTLELGSQRSILARAIARFILRLIGWRTHVDPPPPSSYVLIGAPHTSNWDFIVALLLIAAEGIPARIVGKDTLFRGPMGIIMRSIDAIPVNRRERTNFVDQVAARFDEADELVIAIAPEGTRKKASRWRTGFYYIALKADVPVMMAYLDYENKVCGIRASMKPTGDIQGDFKKIRDYYTGIKGKYPHNQSEIEIPGK